MRLKGAALFRSLRGSPVLDVDAAVEIVRRLGAPVTAMPELEEIDLNPVVLYPAGQGALALDALILTRCHPCKTLLSRPARCVSPRRWWRCYPSPGVLLRMRKRRRFASAC